MKNMAFTLAAKKDYRAAATEADAAIKIRSKTLGPNHPSIGSAASFSAVMCAKTGDHIAARDRHKLAAVRVHHLFPFLSCVPRRPATKICQDRNMLKNAATPSFRFGLTASLLRRCHFGRGD